MIYKLKRKLILICTLSVFLAVFLIFGIILALSVSSMNSNIDTLADRVSEGGGRFQGSAFPPHAEEKWFDFITPETPFSTRHFTVLFDKSSNVTRIFTESIYSINAPQALEYAKTAITEGEERGWISSYRYKIFEGDFGVGVVFIDGSMHRTSLMQSLVIDGAVLLACALLILLLIIIMSKRAVKPIAESYEKQKQFITDAGHELKTPLTLILANLDIAEGELGQNEWLDDIRAEGQRMTELVNRLVALSRMDEEDQTPSMTSLPFGRIVEDTVSEFEPLASSRGKRLNAFVDSGISCRGDEALLRQLVGILLDNAVKYCDPDGEITVSLKQSRGVVLTVENSYSAVDGLELDRLFDRFYRGDSARTFNGGYGIGLSMAKAITEQHKGEISAYKKDITHIGFKVVLH